MKKILFAIALAILSLSAAGISQKAQAQEPFIPTKAGTIVITAEKNAAGKLSGYTKTTIVSSKMTDKSNGTLIMRIEMLDENKKLQDMGDMSCTATIKNGDLYISAPKIAVHATFKDKKTGKSTDVDTSFIGTGEPQFFPVNPKVGETLPNYSFAVKIKFLKLTALALNRKVTAIEKLTINSVTYDCCKIEQTEKAKAMMFGETERTVNWYARGIGPVKSITYDKHGKLDNTEELVYVK
ncbi:MAG: hypothetical protein LKM37_08190 [Bacteroidales bacterium]|jgi:hypothetical protein|nr:hypothetical protein [Bacteroidales bacterium]MCI1733677.1 hypothetical protein [Bacteroidales bacterium]